MEKKIWVAQIYPPAFEEQMKTYLWRETCYTKPVKQIWINGEKSLNQRSFIQTNPTTESLLP